MVESVKIKDMTPEQKEVAFAKWMASDEIKKVANAAKRGAAQLLKKAHEDEFNKFVKSETTRLQKAA